MQTYAHNDVPDVTQTFKHSVLVKNWYEDRFQGDVASASGRQHLTTKERVVHEALPEGHPGLWTTTKKEVDTHMLTSPPPARINKPSMYTDGNLAERLNTYGLPESIHYTIGANAATPYVPSRDFTTTNKEMYETRPAAARTARPDAFPPSPQRSQFGITNAMTKSIRGEPSDQANVAGGKGSRGEMTRRPGESGNVYGVSVFADEYAKWGSALQGMPLEETAARKQTKYFP
ncbi:hypothetical protein GPECTOR_326g46 [Gonium pectorale]|uniref:Uncharacterized protein n=1 Tax=Gonium pectorale TaxID=33097 RepID=A0A150FVM9_GONPE|nr:hypothetical protein GPECTOR_326g46 [Gonium pectorale]|eukprot:KXZ41672.1 hypothetical protein GPECTOR_326g46 [Gonium pectorale]